MVMLCESRVCVCVCVCVCACVHVCVHACVCVSVIVTRNDRGVSSCRSRACFRKREGKMKGKDYFEKP